MQKYLTDLERQRDSYARVSRLPEANAVQVEIDALKQQMVAVHPLKKLPLSSGTQSIVQSPTSGKQPDASWFVGKTWQTER